MSAPTALKKAEDAPPAVDVALPVEGMKKIKYLNKRITETISDCDSDNDDEFLLDAPDALPTDANVLVPVEESNENGMAIDEEGRPRFAPARDIVRLLHHHAEFQ
jgi:RNA-binding protein PNO1